MPLSTARFPESNQRQVGSDAYSEKSIFHCEALTIVGENPFETIGESDGESTGILAQLSRLSGDVDYHNDDVYDDGNGELHEIFADLPDDGEAWIAYDDVKGSSLDPGLVQAARRKEVQILRDRKVYEYASTSEAIRRSGRKPLRLKWVDTDKDGVG